MRREEIPSVLVKWSDVELEEIALFGDELHAVTKITTITHLEGKNRRYIGVTPRDGEFREFLRFDDSLAVVLESGEKGEET
jgi:hypothetical protein